MQPATFRSPRRAAAVALALVALGGCSAFNSPPPPPCPRASILSDAAQMVAFRDGAGRDITDVAFEAEVSSISGSCEYREKGALVDMNIIVTLGVTRGPGWVQGQAKKLTYFVTVVDRLSQQVLNKAEFELPVNFPAGRSRLSTGENEQIGQRIPLRPGRTGADYEVIIGLQLTQEQLEFNRKRRGS